MRDQLSIVRTPQSRPAAAFAKRQSSDRALQIDPLSLVFNASEAPAPTTPGI
jgi:hypothetical protein